MHVHMGERMDRQVGMAIARAVGWTGGLAHGRPKGQAEEASGTSMLLTIMSGSHFVRVLLKG